MYIQFFKDLEEHWQFLSMIVIYTIVIVKLAFRTGIKAKDIVTLPILEEHCNEKMKNCLKEFMPDVQQSKKDALAVHDLETLVKDLRDAITQTNKERRFVMKMLSIQGRHSIKLRSSIANTHMILGVMVNKIWEGKDVDIKRLVDDILKKEQEENKEYLGDKYKEELREIEML